MTNTETAEEVYNLSEATKATGFSATKFTYEPNKELLISHGASFEGTGKTYQIPKSSLIAAGWLDKNGSPIKSERKSRVTKEKDTRSTAEKLSNAVDIAKEKEKAAQVRLDDAKAKLAEAKKNVVAAEKTYEDFQNEERATAQERLKALEEEQKRLKALLGQ